MTACARCGTDVLLDADALAKTKAMLASAVGPGFVLLCPPCMPLALGEVTPGSGMNPAPAPEHWACRRKKLIPYWFSFGWGQRHPLSGRPLGGCYVVIEAENDQAARREMVDRFSQKWCGLYRTAEEAGVERFALSRLEGEEAKGLLGDVRA